MLMQVLDCDYIVLGNKPIVRLFGKTEDGGTACAFYDKLTPYLYVKCADLGEMTAAIKRKFGFDSEVVDRTVPFGYQKPIKVLMVRTKIPSDVPGVKEFAEQNGGTAYEADILFKYRFLVNQEIRGMTWVDVEGKPETTHTVKCKSLRADSFKRVAKMDNAPLKYLTFDIECIAKDGGMPDPKNDPIVMISFHFKPFYKGQETLMLVGKSAYAMGTDVVTCPNENELLKKFNEVVNDYDPDVLIGFNINNFDLPYIIQRMEALQIKKDFSRGDKQPITKKGQNGYMNSVLGRVIVDPYEIIKADPWVHFKRYDLRTIAKEMLGREKMDVGGGKGMAEAWADSGEKLKQFIDYCRNDSVLASMLVHEKGLLDRFFEIAKISGLLLQDALGSQTQRHDCNLLHEFRKRGLLMPCKPSATEMNRRVEERKEAALKGATVLDPETGLHADGSIIVLDFTSLYPSIIRTFNICPTTLLRDGDLKHVEAPSGSKFVTKDIYEGVLPKVIAEMVDTRKEVKKQYKLETDPNVRKILTAKELALKTMANSLYGYTGYPRSRLYCIDIPSSITAYGRHNIMKTKEIVEKNFDARVIYGDTDSVFVKVKTKDLEEAEKIGKEMGAFVTKNLDGLDLKFEKIYKSFLIIAKKRYAGWTFERDHAGWKEKIEMKGIETVRRDWCDLVTSTMRSVLDTILKEQNTGKACLLVRSVLKDLSEGRVPLEKLTVIKGITKSIESYDGMQPHVEVAKKMKSRDRSKGSMVGERIGYVIVRGNDLLSKRAEDPEWVRQKGLQLDTQYYVESQLLPPLERIFEACKISRSELVEGMRQTSLADMLKSKAPSPDKAVLDGYDAIVCKKCHWTFRRPTLSGSCPECGEPLYFSKDGSIGRAIAVQTTK